MRPIIKDIMTKDIYYYDDEFKDKCMNFCINKRITYLPSIAEDNILKNNSCYELRKELFSEEIDIKKEQQEIKASDYIFDKEVLEKFEKSEVQFVFDKNNLMGIMHFSDYNKPVVYVYLYGLLSEYEKLLRELLLESDFKNDDMAKFLEEKHKKSNKLKELPDFQSFYLKDLMYLSKSKNILDISEECVKKCVRIRNTIMHTKDIGCYKEEEFKSFKEFFNDVMIFKKCLRKVDNKVKFKKYKK